MKNYSLQAYRLLMVSSIFAFALLVGMPDVHAQSASITLKVPAEINISASPLVNEVNGEALNNSDINDLMLNGLSPVTLVVSNTGTEVSPNLIVTPLGASDHVQIWVNNGSNWLDVNNVNWIDAKGIQIPTGEMDFMEAYIVSDNVGTYPITFKLVDSSDSSIVDTVTSVVKVSNPEVVGEVLGAEDVSPEIQAQIDSVKAQLATLVQQIIVLLQAEINAK